MQLIAYLREETPIYWVKLGGGCVIKFLIIFVQHYAGCWLVFPLMVNAQPGGLFFYIQLFRWCGVIRPLSTSTSEPK